ncbi:hypothetical protein ACFQJ6_18370 [Halorussus caseinilyticus]|uniref:Mechanosensitive ion channel family protein n=1 Tax=Halorussus caseinilyticus TaxID=3034025 RepID=A0ABD5WMQ6_9EURY
MQFVLQGDDISDLPVGDYLDLLRDFAVAIAVFVVVYAVGRRILLPAVERALSTQRVQEAVAARW